MSEFRENTPWRVVNETRTTFNPQTQSLQYGTALIEDSRGVVICLCESLELAEFIVETCNARN